MDGNVVRILLLEDSDEDARLLEEELERGGLAADLVRVVEKEAYVARLADPEVAVVIADYRVPDFSGLEALALFRQHGPDVPFILVSRSIGTQEAVKAMRLGAQDYLRKDDLHRLVPVLHREIREAEVRRRKREAEQALAVTEQRYGLLLGMLPECVVVMDQGDRLVYVNDAGAALNGSVDPAEYMGMDVREFFRSESSEAFDAMLVQARAEGSLPHFEFAVVTEGGRRIDMDASAVLLPGQRRNLLLVTRDVTERKEADRLKADFVAMVSHELRTPLTTVDGYAQLLQIARYQTPDSVSLLTDRIVRSTSRMKRLVESLLGSLQIEARELNLRLEEHEPRELAESAVRDVPLGDEHRLVEEITEECRDVRCDRLLVSLALGNMLGNAVKFSPEGGEVRLRVDQDERKTRFTVSDDGVGIAPEDQQRIFERFVQGDMSSTRSFGGFGIGLYLVRRTAEAHGGKVEVRSAPGAGSSFTLELPNNGPDMHVG